MPKSNIRFRFIYLFFHKSFLSQFNIQDNGRKILPLAYAFSFKRFFLMFDQTHSLQNHIYYFSFVLFNILDELLLLFLRVGTHSLLTPLTFTSISKQSK